ncbi:fumarylacetoacetate hydrolase family protein [Zooshikella harenae]|uniref:Fumarylacetoacetate hydrolase family protein n=1 Tax=Zooshikella harenae TaxID=2827238 RepID=A0ABS5ZEY9_9GAMM|nr:fumarylacetoacetate hydrolase family protein [Zooshikella harenae]MBU2712550.1 fumarylacetoacetate hydrolase family protein [Zooshikella harenae]
MVHFLRWDNQQQVEWPLGKIVCVGRNYADHAAELNNPVPDQPLLFMKPATAYSEVTSSVKIPVSKGRLHYETELALLIGKPLSAYTNTNPIDTIAGIGLALDLTFRDLQTTLKQKGHPWERAKAFDGSCPITNFVGYNPAWSLGDVEFFCWIDGELRQHGLTKDMLFSVTALLESIKTEFTLLPGDVVLTGTPAGVGRLQGKEAIRLMLQHKQITLLDQTFSTCAG